MRVLERFTGKCMTKETTFMAEMRKLWEDHIIWTRQVIVSVAGDLPDTRLAVDRLMQNQVDIGNSIKMFYGEAAGDKLTSLLKEHISGAYDLIMAAKAGDKAKMDDASKRWYANADDIAVFLSIANPKSWPAPQMKLHMKDHLDMTLAEANARLQGKWAEDIAAYDKIHLQILDMADELSGGIIEQFPGKFNPTNLVG
jgi:hypothetical protein